MQRKLILFLLFCLAVFLATPRIAPAAPGVEVVFSRNVDYVIYGDRGQVDIPVARSFFSILSFPGEFIEWEVMGDPDEFPFGLKRSGRVLLFWGRSSDPGTRKTGSLRLVTSELTVTIRMHLVPRHEMRMAAGRLVRVPDVRGVWQDTSGPAVPKVPFERSVSLHVQALAGGVWLENPLSDRDLEITTMQELGMRMSYHLAEFVAFEAEVAGASSGEARFDDTYYEGRRVDLMRRATFGRVHLGVALRPESGLCVPVMRLGLGLQGARYDAEVEMDDGRVAWLEENDLEIDVLLGFGFGVDFQVGEHFVAGLGVSFRDSINTGQQLLHGGAFMGFRWEP